MFLHKKKYERWIVGWKATWQEIVMARNLNKMIKMVEKMPDEFHHDFLCVAIAHFESMLKLSTENTCEKENNVR